MVSYIPYKSFSDANLKDIKFYKKLCDRNILKI